MVHEEKELVSLIKDMIKINAVIATELIQLVENSSKQLRGDIPEACKIQHGALKKELVEIAEKWHPDCEILKKHNLTHDYRD